VPDLVNDGDGCAPRHPLLGIEIVGGNVDFLNGSAGGYKRHGAAARRTRPRRRPRGYYYCYDGAIDVRAQGAFRGVGDGILKFSGSRARHEIGSASGIPVLVERQVQDCFSLGSVWTSLFSVCKIHDGCLDGDLLGHRAHL